MVLVSVSILPHGAMVLDLAMQGLPNPETIGRLNQVCIRAADKLAHSKPETIIVFTPHGISNQSKPAVYINKSVQGSAGWNGNWDTYSVCGECDLPIAKELLSFLNESEDTKASGITCFSQALPATLAWGEVVPLFFNQSLLDSGAQVVVVSWPQKRFDPTRYTREAHAIGSRTQEFAHKHAKRVAVIFSCDLSHVHGLPSGIDIPAPFLGDPSLGVNKELATQFDAQIVTWATLLSEGKYEQAKNVLYSEQCMGVVAEAKSCGWAGFCAAQGVLELQCRDSMLLSSNGGVSYEVPSYFGMMVASYSFV